jgi:lysophospholipase L1-like esterase
MRGSIGTTLALAIVGLTVSAIQANRGSPSWSGTWGTAVQPATASADWYGPNWSEEGFADHSLRQVIRVSSGGSKVRIRLSNRYGTTALRVAGATIGKARDGASVHPGSLRTLTFLRSAGTVIPPGADIVSDAALLPSSALEALSVTLYLNAPTGPATFHHFAMATSYRARGNQLSDPTGRAFDEQSGSWYYLTGVESFGTTARDTVVAFGDSLTDGVGSTKNADRRYPDRLAERLMATGWHVGVVDAGIGGNRMLSDSPIYGERGLSRFERDVLERPGVRAVIVMDGVNDLAEWNETGPVEAAQLIQGHRALIAAAHTHGIKAIGATIMPMKNSLAGSERAEAVRDEVNRWIRSSGSYDAVVDFDSVVADSADPDQLRAAYDSGDHIHLNDAGYRAVAEAIDLDIL